MIGLKRSILPLLLFAALTLSHKHVYASTNYVRFGGTNRYETSIKISQNNWQKSEYVVLASGDNFPDGLSAAPLAKKYNAPLILTPSSAMSDEIILELQRLGITKAFLVGGAGVLSTKIESQLNGLNINFTRISGNDRYATSVEVAKYIGTDNGVVIASGENFPDALSIAPIAAAKQMPILLTHANSVPDDVEAFLTVDSTMKHFVIGGTGVISNSSLSFLDSYERLSGSNRYLTNSAILKRFLQDINLEQIYLATGNDFADALSGAAAAAKDSTAIVLTDNFSTDVQSTISSNLSSLMTLKILGGTGVISENTVQKFLNVISAASKLVLGYTTFYNSNDILSYNSLVGHASLLDIIATDTFKIDSNGNISGNVPTNQINYANNNGVQPYAMVHNLFNGDLAKAVLEDRNKRVVLVNNILNALRTYNYKGVNIDLEGLYYYDRNQFTSFMQELYAVLHPLGYKVTVAVPAKTNDSLTNSWSGAYDYAQIAKYSDLIVLMTYDEHWSGGTPGPIASIDWVQRVINYSVTVIPKEKILLGLAAYAYDWPSNGNIARSYGVAGAYKIASQYGSVVKWDDTSKSPYFTYTDSSGIGHSVWFENSQSINYKLNIVNNNNLRGAAIWRLGLEDENYWTSIDNMLNK